MLVEQQSGMTDHVQFGRIAPKEPLSHALHPASSWQPPLPKDSSSPPQPAKLASPKPLKRSRPQEEIDRCGESVSRKKRRLRHELVTSRLSRPYATPATHIAQGAWRLGVWARQRLSGGLFLRQGAILNSIAMKRKQAVLERTTNIGLQEGNVTPMCGNTCGVVLPLANRIRSHSDSSHDPPPQSFLQPLSVFTSSDYDSFDAEETEPVEDEEDEEDITGDDQPVYSDFRMLSSSDSDKEFDDASYSFDTLDTSYHFGIDHGEKAINLVMENERQDEVSVVAPGVLPPPFPGFVAAGT